MNISGYFSNIADKLDCFAFWAAVRAICRKQDISTAKCMKKHYRKGRLVFGGGHMLERFRDAVMKRDYRGPKEYMPGGEVRFEEI